MFSFADVLACHPRDGLFLLVQATSGSNVAARVAKVQGRPEAALWIKAGGRCEVWGWRKRAGRWEVRRVEVTADGVSVVEAPKRSARKPRQRGLFEG